MVSKQTVQILIEAQENVSKVAKKAESALSKMGKVGSQGLSKLTSVASKVQTSFSKLSGFVDRAREKFNALKSSGDKLGMIKSTISNAATSFGQLISSSNLASSAMEKIKSVTDGVQSKFTNLKSKITSFGSSAKSTFTNAFNFSNIKSKLSNLGTSIDNLKLKLKNLAEEAKKTGGSGGFGFLKNAASMTVGMLGYDLVNAVMETTRASLNARSGMQAFADRLNMSGEEVAKFQSDLDGLQSTFKKIDMDVVGQQATDMAYRLGLPKTSLSELTETTAIFTDAMQRNGRSAEDSMLAMSDAMDGQFVRLKEIGIDQDKLMKNGWDGDIENKTGLLKAMNKSLKELHYDDLAKSVDTLDDAWQVLNITMGNLLEQILLPLIPTIVYVVNAIGDAVSGVMDFVNNLKTAFSGLPEWAQIGIGIAAVALAIGIAVAAFGGLEAVLIALLGPLFSVAAAVTAISWPLVAVVAVIALFVAAIYEIGKAFGWWTDVGSMFEAISAGIQRMWNAFINHPDVQGAITAISGALKWLSSAIGGAFDEILKFFGVSSSSKWDIVADIINGIGEAWNGLKGAVMGVVGFFSGIIGTFVGIGQSIYDALKPIVCILLGCSPGIVPALQKVYEMFSTVWGAIYGIVAPIISIIVGAVRRLIIIFNLFKSGQISLPTAIMMALQVLWSAYNTIFSKVISLVIKFASKLVSRGMNAAKNFVNAIINWVKTLPGKVASFLTQVASRILSAGAKWVSNAGTKAKGIVDAVKNKLTSLPGTVYTEFMNIGPKIYQAGSDLANKAANAAKKIVDRFKKAAGINSPGYIQIAMVSEFSDMVDRVAEYANPAGKVAGKVASSMVKGFGNNAIEEEIAIDGITGKQFNTSDGKYISSNSSKDNVDVNFKGDMDFNINLSGIPERASTSEITSIFEDLFNDPSFKNNFMREIARSVVFQNEDGKQKAKITAKNKRARGI